MFTMRKMRIIVFLRLLFFITRSFIRFYIQTIQQTVTVHAQLKHEQ